MTKKNIYITGAGGFLGSKLADRLTDNVAYNISATARRPNSIDWLTTKNANVFYGDLCNKELALSTIQNCDIVVHCAALSAPWGKYEDFYNANIKTTENIIDACYTNKVQRLIHISTPSIYFNFNDRLNITEEETLPDIMVNDYAITKYIAEQKVIEAGKNGLEVIILRPRAIVGAGDTTIMPRLLKAYKENKLRIIGNGKNIADLTSVSNLIDAIELSFVAPKNALGHAYNITNGNPVVLWDMINSLLQKMNFYPPQKKIPYSIAYTLAYYLEWIAKAKKNNTEPVLTRYGVGVMAKSMTMSIEKAKINLGYNPIQSNDEAIAEFVKWWQQNN